jgi:hypothetical protein
MRKFPDISPYVAFANNPIVYTDPYGLEPVNGDDKKKGNGQEAKEGSNEFDGHQDIEGVDIVAKRPSNNNTGLSNEDYSNITNPNPFNEKVKINYSQNIENAEDFGNFLKTYASNPNSQYVVVGGNVNDVKAHSTMGVTVGGIVMSVLEYTNYNTQLDTWLGKNGKVYKSLKGRGPNQHTGSRGSAKNMSKAFNYGGQILFFVSATIDGANAIESFAAGDIEAGIRSTESIVLGGIMTYGGPVGLVAGGTGMFLRWAESEGYVTLDGKDHMKNKSLRQQNNISQCFVAGTKVSMDDGSLKNIEDVVVGDSVKSFNFENGLIENKPVLEIESPMHRDLIAIYFINDSVNINTTDHPYYVKGKGWCSFEPEKTERRYGLFVKQLKIGDECYFINSTDVVEIKISKIVSKPNLVRTYNLSKVSGNKNFFANGFLVHNKMLLNED